MDDIMHEYTAGEFLQWLSEKESAPYIVTMINVDGNGYETFDIEKLKTDFIHFLKRYEVFCRGNHFIIHDNKDCVDLVEYDFDAESKEKVQAEVNDLCDRLNTRKIHFIGKKYRCD